MESSDSAPDTPKSNLSSNRDCSNAPSDQEVPFRFLSTIIDVNRLARTVNLKKHFGIGEDIPSDTQQNDHKMSFVNADAMSPNVIQEEEIIHLGIAGATLEFEESAHIASLQETYQEPDDNFKEYFKVFYNYE